MKSNIDAALLCLTALCVAACTSLSQLPTHKETRFTKPCNVLVNVALVDDRVPDALCRGNGMWDSNKIMEPFAQIGGCTWASRRQIIVPEDPKVLFSEMEHIWEEWCRDPSWKGKVVHGS